MTGVTWDAVAKMNSENLKENEDITKEAALALLADEQLDNAAPVSLNSDAPLTCQFLLEDHAVRHSYHHLAGIRAAVEY